MREQNRDPEIMKSSNLTDSEFKTLVIKMLNKFLGHVDKFSKERRKHKNGNGNFKREPVLNEEHII